MSFARVHLFLRAQLFVAHGDSCPSTSILILELSSFLFFLLTMSLARVHLDLGAYQLFTVILARVHFDPQSSAVVAHDDSCPSTS